MKLLPYSNGVRSVQMRKKWKVRDIIKIIVICLGIFILSGFIYQKSSNFIANETLKLKVDYTRVNDMRLDYISEGQGKYTVIFDGNMGADLSQWKGICDKLNSQKNDIKTFVYNRRGYGLSDGGDKRTPEEQAEDLKILLRKAAVPPPYILVGEEYGSLVLTNFAKLYPDTVAGVVLVNPMVEEKIGTEEFAKENRVTKIRRRLEQLGSHVGLTTLLDKCNLDVKLDGFEDKLDDNALKAFTVMRTKLNYTRATYNELLNLLEGTSHSQTEGLLKGKPYYLLARDGQESLKKLGDENLTNVLVINNGKDIASLENENYVIDAINNVVKEAKKIEKHDNKK